VIAVLSEVLHGGVNDAGALGVGSGTRSVLAYITWGRDGTTGNSAHE
jgi:hypothetical protein